MLFVGLQNNRFVGERCCSPTELGGRPLPLLYPPTHPHTHTPPCAPPPLAAGTLPPDWGKQGYIIDNVYNATQALESL